MCRIEVVRQDMTRRHSILGDGPCTLLNIEQTKLSPRVCQVCQKSKLTECTRLDPLPKGFLVESQDGRRFIGCRASSAL